MRAVVYDRYGPPEVLRLEDVERPVPDEDQVLIRIHATTVNRTDCGWRKAEPFIVRYFIGLRRPKMRILGMELAGEVAAVGAAVTEFAVGDEVFGVTGFGAHAEFVGRAPGRGRFRAQAAPARLRGGRSGLRRSVHRALVPEEGRPPRGSEHPRVRRVGIGAGPPPCSSRSTSAPTSRRSAATASCVFAPPRSTLPTGTRSRAGRMSAGRWSVSSSRRTTGSERTSPGRSSR